MSEQSTAASAGNPPPRWILKLFTRAHLLLYRLFRGRLFSTLAGDPICIVTMTGAKSGKKRSIPLMLVPHPDGLDSGVLLVASQGGAPRHPVWYYNLVAHPDIVVEAPGKKLRLRARVASPEEKKVFWPVCVEHYAPYEDYQQRTDRDIPVFVCEPRAA